MIAFLVVGCGVFGLLVGSFLNVVIWRVPRDESIITPRSKCPACGTQLRSLDNIPVVSWLMLRGKCHACGEAISPRYPLVELLTGVLFAAAALRFGYDWALPAFLVLLAGLVAVSAVDIDLKRIPNKIVYPTGIAVALLLGVAAAATGEWGDLARAAAGGLIGFTVLFLIYFVAPRGMGFGDVRLAAVIGLALGWFGLGYVALGLFLAFLTSSVIGIALIAARVATRKSKIPFGPFLALGAVLAVFFGDPLLRLYGL